MIIDLFVWWYSDGWLRVARNIAHRTKNVARMFSVGSLLRTFFSPFKRLQIYNESKFQMFLDSLFHRFMGAIFRSIILFIATVFIVSSLVYGIALLVIWPMMPLIVFYSLAKGLLS